MVYMHFKVFNTYLEYYTMFKLDNAFLQASIYHLNHYTRMARNTCSCPV